MPDLLVHYVLAHNSKRYACDAKPKQMWQYGTETINWRRVTCPDCLAQGVEQALLEPSARRRR